MAQALGMIAKHAGKALGPHMGEVIDVLERLISFPLKELVVNVCQVHIYIHTHTHTHTHPTFSLLYKHISLSLSLSLAGLLGLSVL